MPVVRRPATRTRSITRSAASSSITGATDPSGYTWNFSGNIWSYTILVTRRKDDGNNVTYDAPTANVLTSSGAVDATQYVNCSSAVPSDGFSCSAPGPGASSDVGSRERHEPAVPSVHPGR